MSSNRLALKNTAMAVSLLVVVSAGNAFAASDGTLGATSSGSTNVSLTVPELIRVSGIDNLTLNPYSSGDVDLTTDVCIYTNDEDGQYDVTISGDGGPNQAASFQIGDAATTDDMTYTAAWNDVSGTNTNETAVTHGNELTVQTGANTTSQTCSGGSSARLHINITEAEVLAQAAGTYIGTITILVEPDASN